MHHRRRRNPVTRGTFGEAANYAVAAIGVGFFKPILTRFVGSLLPFGQFNGPILTAGTGYAVSALFGMFTFTKRFAHAAWIVGLSAGIVELVNPYIRGVLGSVQSPLMSAPHMAYRGQRMRGIAAVPSTQPPGIGAPAMPPAAGNGMQGIAAYPTVGAFRR